MARLPQPGGDAAKWGSILNDYLSQAHNANGNLRDSIVTTTQLELSGQASLAKANSAIQPADINGSGNVLDILSGATE